MTTTTDDYSEHTPEAERSQQDYDVMIEHLTRLLAIQDERDCSLWEAEQILRGETP